MSTINLAVCMYVNLLVPDQTFNNPRASIYVDQQTLCSLEMKGDEFPGSKIVK